MDGNLPSMKNLLTSCFCLEAVEQKFSSCNSPLYPIISLAFV